MLRQLAAVVAMVIAASVGADPSAQVRLADESDRAAFRAWFVLLADAQFERQLLMSPIAPRWCGTRSANALRAAQAGMGAPLRTTSALFAGGVRSAPTGGRTACACFA